MEKHLCLNCSTDAPGKFCANCGQKTGMHRITFVHFIAHDLVHGMFHLDRGIAFTMKEALIRPGKAALDYISGKRVRYYNVFYLSLILIGLAIVLYSIGVAGVEFKGNDQGSQDVIDVMTGNAKLVVLCYVPLLAINARVLFWKLRLNLAEHFIVAGFTFVGMLLLIDFALAINAITSITSGSILVNWILVILCTLAFFFPLWAYANLAWKTHSALGWLWRMVILYALLVAELFLLLVLIIFAVTGETDVSFN
jgi:hypothetical protein